VSTMLDPVKTSEGQTIELQRLLNTFVHLVHFCIALIYQYFCISGFRGVVEYEQHFSPNFVLQYT